MSRKLFGDISENANIYTENIEAETDGELTEDTLKILDERQEAKKKKLDYSFLKIAFAVFALFLLLKAIGSPVTVIGSSMSPTYESGQMLIGVRKYISSVDIGDVVVIKNDMTGGRLYIKRVEGVPGDKVVIRDGKLYRNGQVVEEGFKNIDFAGILGVEITLQEDQYLVLGDNRNNSEDSRYIGPVSYGDIKYVIINSNNGSRQEENKK